MTQRFTLFMIEEDAASRYAEDNGYDEEYGIDMFYEKLDKNNRDIMDWMVNLGSFNDEDDCWSICNEYKSQSLYRRNEFLLYDNKERVFFN